MKPRLPFSSRRVIAALALALPVLAAASGCSSGSSSLDSWSCECAVSTPDGKMENQTFTYCGAAPSETSTKPETDANAWVDGQCLAKNTDSNCQCGCTPTEAFCSTATTP